jgi:ribosome maturation protein SDO1
VLLHTSTKNFFFGNQWSSFGSFIHLAFWSTNEKIDQDTSKTQIDADSFIDRNRQEGIATYCKKVQQLYIMSQQISLPINKVRLTNVAVVRMNKNGKRFEIACYRNKVMDYRQGLEQDLSEVLQTERVFTNVSKGEFAKAKDLQAVFGTKDEDEISKLILTKGQVQVSDKERSQQLEKTNAQIAEWISKNCVHPTSDRPYTISQIRHAMQQANFSVHPTKHLKRQYLDCVKMLQGVIPVQRAKMELLLLVPDGEHPPVEEAMKQSDVTWISPEGESDGQYQYNILVDPSLYRVLNEVIQKIDGARIEIVTQVVTKQGDVNLEAELGLSIADGDDFAAKIAEQSAALNDTHIGTSGDTEKAESDDDEEEVVVSRKQQQKNARKKNKKSKRRETDPAPRTTDSEASPAQPSLSSQRTAATATDSTTDDRKSCNTCGGFFNTAAAYRSHFKSDWHRFNQKLKLKDVAPIGEEEFLLCDADTFFSNGM